MDPKLQNMDFINVTSRKSAELVGDHLTQEPPSLAMGLYIFVHVQLSLAFGPLNYETTPPSNTTTCFQSKTFVI